MASSIQTLLQTAACQKVISKISCAATTRNCWEFFFRLLEIPRPSGHLEPVRLEIRNICTKHGWNYDSDDVGNVLISVPATNGFEHAPSICFQGHCDMVCVAEEGITHNFKTDSIVPRIEGDWLKATGTSLGSDNGAGLAIAMAILADKDLKHGPLELLVTVDEETSMIGAHQLRRNWLKSKLLINLDSEKERAVCIGCAGGFNLQMSVPVTRAAFDSKRAMKIKIMGLTGGHSGVDIHRHRCSAIQLMGRLLFRSLQQGGDFRISSVSGGNARNAIPKTVSVVIFPKEPAKITKMVTEIFGELNRDIAPHDPEGRAECSDADATAEMIPADEISTRKVAAFMITAPYGVVRMSLSVPDLVETSFATTLASTSEDAVLLKGMGRSSKMSEMQSHYEWIEALCAGFGAKTSKMEDCYPGWDPNPTSPFLKIVRACHNEVLGNDPEIYAIHAGLECGVIADKYPGMDCISIGPQIEDPHSPQEKILIASVERCLNLARGIVQKVAESMK